MNDRFVTPMLCLCAALACTGCSGDAEPASSTPASAADDHAATPTNRTDIPPAVRQNLGITFVQVEARRVKETLRVPGRFEYLPTARREYRTMLPGRVELIVDQYSRIDAGDPLYTIDSPGWRALQQQLADAEAAIQRLATRLASFGPLRHAHHHHEQLLEEIIEIRKQRVAQLESVALAGGGRVAELGVAQGEAATAEADLAEVLEKEAALEADEAETKAELAAARSKREFLLDTASTLSGLPVNELLEQVEIHAGTRPRWGALATITVHAAEPGVVESLGLTNGAWANEEVAVLTIVQPESLRFHAVGLQSDLGWLRDGLPARIVAPSPTRAAGSIDLTDSMQGELTVGLAGDPRDRTVDLFVTPGSLSSWARPGVSAQLEIVTNQTAAQVLAIPKAAVQRDGLVRVLFRRDPDDPNKAIRVEADLGIDDGRWVQVKSGLRAGDEVVLDGAFQLMLASSGGGQEKGGHFHSDGTFHAGDE